jgi:D-tyrosyl-tRNA(Tyr) deacylase
MIALIQRVLEASVTVDSQFINSIGEGLLVLLSIRSDDTEQEAEYLAAKTVNLRIFNDENAKMNRSLIDTGTEMLVISQFTLHADTRHGNRPSFTDAGEPARAEELYKYYIQHCKKYLQPGKVKDGIFAAMMKIKLVNDGPVTIILKSKNEYNK